jgi:hypothetical protein
VPARTFAWKKMASGVAAVAVVFVAASGCSGRTVIVPESGPGPYSVSMGIDPPTLNPPQTASLSFDVTDTSTNKPVVAFERVSNALLHTVVISRDLQHFRHSYTEHLVGTHAAVYTFFPSLGEYFVYSLFKPAGAEVETFRASITAGGEGAEPDLVEDSSPVKSAGWLTFRLFTGASPIKRGQPTQLVYNVSERGRAVTALWPYLGAAGHLWIVDEHAGNFAHLAGISEARRLLPTATPSGAEPTGTPTGEETVTAGGVAGEVTGGTGAAGQGAAGTSSGFSSPQDVDESVLSQPSPTLVPSILNALATVTVLPPQQLAPVQQTAQSSVLTTPEVPPGIGFGPNIVFTHTFPEAGLYKLWLEVQHRGQVALVAYVVKVVE